MKLKLFTALVLALCVRFVVGAQDTTKIRTGSIYIGRETVAAQVTTPVQTEPQNDLYSSPDQFFDKGLVGTVQAGVLAIIAYLGGFIPRLRKIKSKFVLSGSIIFICMCALLTFKYGAFTEAFLNALLQSFIPNFAYSGVIYQVIKTVLQWAGKPLPQPTA